MWLISQKLLISFKWPEALRLRVAASGRDIDIYESRVKVAIGNRTVDPPWHPHLRFFPDSYLQLTACKTVRLIPSSFQDTKVTAIFRLAHFDGTRITNFCIIVLVKNQLLFDFR